MKWLNNSILLSILWQGCVFGQTLTNSLKINDNQVVKTKLSRILKVNDFDTAIVKVEMTGALYDHENGNLPYFLVNKETGYEQNAVPTLIVKNVSPVNEAQAKVIRKYHGKSLSSDFKLIPLSSHTSGKNLNQYRYFPFRLNASGQVEELIEMEISWKTVFSPNNQKLSTASSFKSSSVLANGNWYKIGIVNTGVYSISYDNLRSMGIDMSQLDPRKIRLYGNGGLMIPESNSAFRYDDLEENSIIVTGEQDGVFNAGDKILFYGLSGVNWKRNSNVSGVKFVMEQNLYSDTSFYYLNFDLGAGKRIQTKASTGGENVTTDTYDYRAFHEVNSTNFVKSGRQFFGEYFDITNSYAVTFNQGELVTGDTLETEVVIAGRSSTPTNFNLSGNGINLNVTAAAVDVSNYLANYADVASAVQKRLNTSSSSINFNIVKQSASGVGWLDKVTIAARRYLVANKQFNFRDTRVTGSGKVCKFQLSSWSGNASFVWNVTDPINPVNQQLNVAGSNADFTTATDSLLEFVVVPDGQYYSATYIKKVENQNIHAVQQADYVIVTHPLFLNHAQRLAVLHKNNEGLSYLVVTTDQVYNEFGSGKADPAAIRDLMRMLYSRNLSTGKQPKYLLLFGDGSYDNRNHDIATNSAFIPTYQTPMSLSVLNSIATDDFYGLLDPNEGVNSESFGTIDLGIGRIVARNIGDAEAAVTKVENYYKKEPNFGVNDQAIANCNLSQESTFGDWKNWMVFLGDDEDQSTHMADADKVALKAKQNAPNMNLEKIYLDAYQQFSTPGGQRYPDAYTDLQRRLKKGAVIFNYTGHGGEVGLTEERLIDLETINSWDNFNRLSLFVTATCEFTRYDDPGRTSAGEFCLLNPKGGAIALLTTCRLAYSHTNLTLNLALYDYVFKKLPDGRKPSLGDIIRRTKQALNQNFNYSNFHLIGDPAVTLSYPDDKKIVTTKFNTKVLSPTSSDTISALSKITISGFVADTLGNKLSGFNGIIFPTVFDKEQTVSCLLNDADSYYFSIGTPFNFKLQKNILYRGKVEVKNGDFTFSFIVPKDISFAYGPGRISYYATNGMTEAAGTFTNVVVGGGATNPIVDNVGPQISLFLNDKNFVNGGTTNEKPVLYAQLTDSSGINTVGSSIGHDISVVLDGNASKPVVLNEFYEANLNTYQQGTVRYPFEDVQTGPHTLAFKAWDIQNNSNVTELDFVVAPSEELALKHVLNYPNPFTTSTKFFLEHNQACNPLKVIIQIYTISGKIVKTIQRSVTCEGFRPEGIDWDGKDDFGDKLARGVYIYRVTIMDTENKKAEKTEKLVILN